MTLLVTVPDGTQAADRAADKNAGPTAERALSSLERQHIMKVIAETGGNKARAARQLGLSRRALYRRLERHGLAQPAARETPQEP